MCVVVDLYDQLELETLREFPDFTLRHKSNSTLMKVLDLLLKIITFGQMTSFMTHFITTMGTTVYVHTEWPSLSDIGKAVILRHERIHMRQRKRYGNFLFTVMYLLVLPTLWTWRAKLEKEAYEETFRAMLDYVPAGDAVLQSDAYRTRVVRYFTTSQYFWMWPFKSRVERWYREATTRAQNR